MLSQELVIDKIEILEDGQMQIRTARRVFDDGVQISETYHRRVINPSQDVSKENVRVKAVADVLWTQEVKDAWEAKQGGLR